MLSRWLKSWTHRTATRRPESRRAIPTLEGLEDRITPVLFSYADLQMVNIASTTSSVIAGDTQSFVTTIKNNGPTIALGVKLSEQFSASLTNIHFTPSSGTYNSATGNWTGFSLRVGQSITMTATGVVNAAATGKLNISAAISPPTVSPGLHDPNLSNNSLSKSFTISQVADLEAFQSDNSANPHGSAVPGSTGTLTVLVANAGPSTVTGATVTDTFPAAYTNVSWTTNLQSGATITTGSTGSGSGNINTKLNLPPGAFVLFTITVTIDPSATGSASNTATITDPAGVTDPNLNNNSATDTLTLTPKSDLAILKEDNVGGIPNFTTNNTTGGTIVPGQDNTVVYTILVGNDGLSTAVNQAVTDTLSTIPGFVSDSWTASATTGSSVAAASGTGNISTTVTLLPNGIATYIVTAVIHPAASATGTASNTATVAIPSGDTTPNDNTSTDSLTLTPQSDLSIAKTDNVGGIFSSATNNTTGGAVVPGQDNDVTYTIVVTNNGPSTAVGQAVTDSDLTSIPGLVSESWSAVASTGSSIVTGSSGTGNIASTVTLLPNGTATYTVMAVIDPDPAATGTISNTATVAAPTGDTTPNNNTSTDTLTLTPQANLTIAKTDDANQVLEPSQTVTFTVTITNSGPSSVTGVSVSDVLPAGLTFVSGGTGVNFDGTTVTFTTGTLAANNGAVSFTFQVTTPASISGSITNTATLTPPNSVTDTNSTASASDTLTPGP